jgi:hypothetical protein
MYQTVKFTAIPMPPIRYKSRSKGDVEYMNFEISKGRKSFSIPPFLAAVFRQLVHAMLDQ